MKFEVSNIQKKFEVFNIQQIHDNEFEVSKCSMSSKSLKCSIEKPIVGEYEIPVHRTKTNVL